MSLSLITGSILEDEKVIGTLETLKSEAAEIQEKVKAGQHVEYVIPEKIILSYMYNLLQLINVCGNTYFADHEN